MKQKQLCTFKEQMSLIKEHINFIPFFNSQNAFRVQMKTSSHAFVMSAVTQQHIWHETIPVSHSCSLRPGLLWLVIRGFSFMTAVMIIFYVLWTAFSGLLSFTITIMCVNVNSGSAKKDALLRYKWSSAFVYNTQTTHDWKNKRFCLTE